MKQHFITIRGFQTKNQANAMLQRNVMEYDNCLTDDLKLKELLLSLQSRIAEINLVYPRCLDIKWGTSSFTAGHSSFFVEGNFQMSITEVKRFELSDQEGVIK